MTKPYTDPSEVTAERGEVQVDGPDGVAVSMTPNAAKETAHRLVRGAAEAAGQNVEGRSDDQKRGARGTPSR